MLLPAVTAMVSVTAMVGQTLPAGVVASNHVACACVLTADLLDLCIHASHDALCNILT